MFRYHKFNTKWLMLRDIIKEKEVEKNIFIILLIRMVTNRSRTRRIMVSC